MPPALCSTLEWRFRHVPILVPTRSVSLYPRFRPQWLFRPERGRHAKTIEIYVFAPGVDPATLEVQLERGLLSVASERKSSLPESDAKTAVHINERFEGRFRRVITLPEDADPEQVEAKLHDGVLRITVQRRASAQPRRIATARKIAVLFYNAMRFGMKYVDPGVNFYEACYRERVVKQLHRRAARFGITLQPTEAVS